MENNIDDNLTKMTGNYSWKFYLSAQEAWDAMYSDCATASESIKLEQYIFENDDLGRRFLELFIKKAQQGVTVILICDPFGSSSLSRSPLVAELQKAGGIFRFYQPLKLRYLFNPKRRFPRTHIKTLLIDSKIFYSGGVCICQRMKNWRDTHLKIIGPIADEVKRRFIGQKKNAEARRDFRNKIKADFYYLENLPLRSFPTIYREFTDRIKKAQRYIYISTAFFMPDERFIFLLKKAARRGVKVMILATQHSDSRLADWMALLYFERLVKNNVRAFHYHKSVFHSKTMVVDGEWATVGSTNIDILSFFYNREANVMITEKKAIAELEGHFMNDLNGSTEFTKNSFSSVPPWQRILGLLAQSIKNFFKR